MAFEQDRFSSKFRLPAEQVAKTIESGLPGLDAGRAQSLGQLGLVRDAKARALTREQVLLTRKRGVDHPRLAVLAQRHAVNETLRREVATAREYAETPSPTPAADTFVVHGFVRRRSGGAGVPGLTLALTDAKGVWVRAAGFACTDARGYFRLEVSTERAAAYDDPQKLSALSDADGVRITGHAEAKASLYLRVFDRQNHVLHIEKRPVAVRGGGVDLRLIQLDETGDCGCSPPSGPGDLPSGPVQPSTQPPTATAPAPAPAPLTAPTAGGAVPVAHVGRLKSYAGPAPSAPASSKSVKSGVPRAAKKATRRKS